MSTLAVYKCEVSYRLAGNSLPFIVTITTQAMDDKTAIARARSVTQSRFKAHSVDSVDIVQRRPIVPGRI